jgi:hypothetical protein
MAELLNETTSERVIRPEREKRGSHPRDLRD